MLYRFSLEETIKNHNSFYLLRETIRDVRSVFLYPRIIEQRLSDFHLPDSEEQIGHSTKNRMGISSLGDSCGLWDFLGPTGTESHTI